MKKRKSKQNNNKNILTVKVKDTVDLTAPLNELNTIRQKIISDGTNQKEELHNVEEDLEKKIKDSQKEVSKLKDSFNEVIEKVSSA